MGKIGDVYYVVSLDAKGIPQLAKKEGEKAGDAMGKGFGARMKANLKATFAGTKGGFLGALGIGAGIGIATVALGKLTDVMGDAVAAAIEEEKSIAKLDTALRANVEGYDGNTDAIERVLAARMSLGFADDEQRESLALLIAATGDYNKALDIQRTAMDLARLKGISLAEASEALVKVEAGSFRILKSLGIVLKDGATQTEALAAVQKVAAGQAESYAKTTEGKLLVSQVKVGEAMEKLGAKLLPIVVAAAEGAAEAVEKLALIFEGFTGDLDALGDTAERTKDPMVGLGEVLSDVFKKRTDEAKTGVGELNDVLTDMFDNLIDGATFWDDFTLAIDDAEKKQRDSAEASREAGRGLGVAQSAAADATPVIVELGEQGKKAGRKLKTAAHEAGEAFKTWRDRVIGYARDIVDKAYQIIEDKAELNATNEEIRALKRIASTRKWTSEEAARYTELTHRQTELVLDLAANGAEGQKVVNTAMNQIRARLKTATGNERKALLATLSVLKQLAAAAERARLKIQTAVNLARLGLGSQGLIGGNWGPVGGSAQGGPIPAGIPRWTGEHGRELIVPLVDSMVIPHDESMQLAGGFGGGDTINIPLSITGLPMTAEGPADVVREMRRATRLGLAPARRQRTFG